MLVDFMLVVASFFACAGIRSRIVRIVTCRGKGKGSINSSSTLVLDSRLVIIIHFSFTTRNLLDSVI